MRFVRALPGVLLLFVTIAGAVALEWPDSPPPPRPPRPRSAAALALLDDLHIGERVGRAEVVGASGPDHGVLTVELVCPEGEFTVTITPLAAVTGPTPPVTTRDYALFYGRTMPRHAAITEATYRGVVTALADRLRATEQADAPAGEVVD